VGISVFTTITTDTQYAITSLRKYSFWLLIILDLWNQAKFYCGKMATVGIWEGWRVARAETMIELQLSMPLVTHRWNCRTCNQRLKFSTELCVLFIYICGMESIWTQIMCELLLRSFFFSYN